MTPGTGERPPKAGAVAGCLGAVAGAVLGIVVAAVGGVVLLVLGAVAVLVAFAPLFRMGGDARGTGVGLLAGYAVGSLVASARASAY